MIRTLRERFYLANRSSPCVEGVRPAEFARDEGVDASLRAVLVLDHAGRHRAADLAIAEGIHPAFLPASSPELEPAERGWPLTNEVVAGHALADLDAHE